MKGVRCERLLWKIFRKFKVLKFNPFWQGQQYYVRDYSFDFSNFPPELPKGDYRIDIGMKNSADHKWFFKIEIYVSLARKLMAEIKWH